MRCGRTPLCITFRARVAKLLFASEEFNDNSGSSASQARVNTALCDASECKDWCIVSLYKRVPDAFVSELLSSEGLSSKYLRQSSSASALSSCESTVSSRSSSSSLPAADFGFGGRVPSSSTHHEFNSDASVGNVVIRSSSESRLSATCEFLLRAYVASSPLFLCQLGNTKDETKGVTHADSLRKNHRMSSHSLSHVSTNKSLTSGSSLPSLRSPSSAFRRLE